jgi:hypothetical protein
MKFTWRRWAEIKIRNQQSPPGMRRLWRPICILTVNLSKKLRNTKDNITQHLGIQCCGSGNIYPVAFADLNTAYNNFWGFKGIISVNHGSSKVHFHNANYTEYKETIFIHLHTGQLWERGPSSVLPNTISSVFSISGTAFRDITLIN